MKILLATPFMSQHFDAGLFWAKALCDMNHSVVLWDYRMNPEKVLLLNNYNYDLTIVFKGEGIDPQTLPHPKLCYWPDDLNRIPGVEDILKQYSKVFTPVRPTPDWMEWLPSGWDPLIHRDLGYARGIYTTYIGTNNSQYKLETVEGIGPEAIYGNSWPQAEVHAGPAVYLRDFVEVANRSQILIDVHQSSTVGINRKLFEMIACGFTIVDRVPGVEEIFPDIWNLISFNGVKSANEMITHFLENPKLREELWIEERKAIEPYTYENCVRRLLGK